MADRIVVNITFFIIIVGGLVVSLSSRPRRRMLGRKNNPVVVFRSQVFVRFFRSFPNLVCSQKMIVESFAAGGDHCCEYCPRGL